MTIEMRLDAIYEAAHVSIPDQATFLSSQGDTVSGGVASASAEIDHLGHGLAGDIFALGDEIVFRLRQITGTMNDCSLALDQTADDFAARDDDARTWLDGHRGWLERNQYGGTPEPTPRPEMPERRR